LGATETDPLTVFGIYWLKVDQPHPNFKLVNLNGSGVDCGVFDGDLDPSGLYPGEIGVECADLENGIKSFKIELVELKP